MIIDQTTVDFVNALPNGEEKEFQCKQYLRELDLLSIRPMRDQGVDDVAKLVEINGYVTQFRTILQTL